MVRKQVRNDQSESEILLETSLQSFFFDQLSEVNNKSQNPLPNETIFYSSTVLDKFSESSNYFEKVEGRIREKILGLKLLESQNLSRNGQKRILNDIGDTALFMCGYFSESTNRKIVDTKYYMSVGMLAYQRLHAFESNFMEYPRFYLHLSKSFSAITLLIGTVAHNLNSDTGAITYFVNTIKPMKVS